MSRLTPDDAEAHPRRPAEDYAEAAGDALAAGDVAGALEQVAAALSLQPEDGALLELLGRVVAASGDPLGLALAEGDAFFGLVAVRAQIFAEHGRLDDALDYLFAAVLAEPSVGYLPWVSSWVARPGGTARLDPTRLAGHLAALLEALPEGPPAPGLAANLGAAADVATRVGEERSSPQLVALASQLLRAAGRDEEALARLNAATAKAPAWETLVATGALHRSRCDFDRAAAAFEQAAATRPAEPATYLDWGDALLESGRYAGARAAFCAALERDPSNDWAAASKAFLDASDGADDLAAGELARLASRGGPRSRAAALLRQLRAYESELPPPVDALSHVVRSVLARAAEAPAGKPLRVVVRSARPGPPSAQVALALGLARLRRAGTLVVECEDRQRTAPPTGPLWRAEGNRLVPALREPPPAVTRAVAALAREPFERKAWQERARRMTLALADRAALAASMTHPPPPPDGVVDVVTWVARAQVAAALLVAWGETTWQGSLRREVLMGILGGPDDGTTAAACVALCGVAECDRVARAEVVTTFARLAGHASPDDPPGFAFALAWASLRLGVSDDEQRVHLRSLARASVRGT